MDPSRSSPQDLAQVQAQLLQLQNFITSIASSSQPGPSANVVHFAEPLVQHSSALPASTPVTERYQSARALPAVVNSSQGVQGHPSSLPAAPAGLGFPATSSQQPFLGMHSLGLNLATGHVNQARLASASATIPRQPSLTRRGRRRGPAVHPPSLPNTRPDIRQCYVEGAPDSTLRITVKVYPPHVSIRF
jgi:hypothetical protein